MKRFLKPLLMLTVIIAACIILNPTKAHAATTSDLTFTLNDDGNSYSVTGCNGSATGELAIPATYNSKPVASIGSSAFYNCKKLTSLTIPDSVTTIGNGAFHSCTGLTSVSIGNGVTAIGSTVFYGCSSLTSLTIPDSITTIGTNAFYNCKALSYNIYNNAKYLGNETNPYAVLICSTSTSATQCLIHPDTKLIYSSAFSSCTKLTDITIPDSVTTIGNSAFSSCTGLTSVIIPDSVTTIGNSAFSSCTGLTSVTISKSMTTISSSAFSGCSGLTSVTIPDGVKSISGSAFSSCTKLTDITIPGSVTTIGYKAFAECSSLTSVTIPDSITAIGDYAFCDCRSLTSINIPDGVTTIESFTFYDCRSLTSITLSDNISVIGMSAFNGCTSLADITIGNKITYIGSCAFKSCQVLTDIAIPDSVSYIGSSAFAYCKNLTGINIPEEISAIEADSFNGCSSLTNVTIPDSVTSIGDSAFCNCTNLTGINIPESVVTIGEYAFASCVKFADITIPDGVISIGKLAFDGCSNLRFVYYTGTRYQWNMLTYGTNNTTLRNATLFLVNHCDTYGHTPNTIPAVANTCGKDGWTEGKVCTYCGEIFAGREVIPATGLHIYDHDFDSACNVCNNIREVGTLAFVNYRVVFTDSDTTHKNWRAEVYKLGTATVSDPTDETALKAIDGSPIVHWGISSINKILLTDAGNYVVLLKYNVGTAPATKLPLVISVSADPKLIIDKNNKLTAIETNANNLYHRVVVYYLGEQIAKNLYDETALKEIDSEPGTIWNIRDINRITLTKGGNYVIHLCYNIGTSSKITVAQQFTVESIPTLSVDINNKVVVTEENAENKNHRAVVYFLGENTVEDPYDETAVKAAAVTTSKTYWGLTEINALELKEGGNYVIHLNYNVGTSDKRTLALDVTLNERPALSLSNDNKLVVAYTDPEITNPRAYIYKIDDAEIADIYDEAALKAIATPTQVWGLSSINKKQLTEPGTYVIHFYYSVGTSAKKTVALKVTI